MDFKLLGLQINKKSSFTKNLKEGVLYQFTQDFKFIYDFKKTKKHSHRNLVEIKHLNTFPNDLYEIQHLTNTSQVSITAILGKNGAGKSTLLELLYLLIFCLSERKGYLKEREANSQKGKELAEHYNQVNMKIDEILKESQMELYYKFDDKFYLITNSGKQINFYELNNKEWKTAKFNRTQFFYTICVNYSLHGLNSSRDYFWLNSLFHKNDGYKTPLVITPWRDKGNMNINTELHLAQTRILANLISESFESQAIIDDKVVAGIEFKVSPSDIGKIDRFSLEFLYRKTKEINGVDLVDLFESLINNYDPAIQPEVKGVLEYLRKDLIQGASDVETTSKINKFIFKGHQPVDRHLIRCLLAKYIISKIVKICMRYSDFQEFTCIWNFEDNNVANILLIDNPSGLVKKIKSDQSHVTLKLKQAINAFLFDYLNENIWKIERDPDYPKNAIYTTNLNFEDLQILVRKTFETSEFKKKTVSQFIPTGFYLPTIYVKSDGEEFPFGHLSSGEQQMVHSIHAILYHILNIDSLADSNNPYQAINLVLDEIELYYHPEYQRLFVKKLLDSLSKLQLRCISRFNVIFSTHSPFILSDIPHRNVLKLRNGESVPFDDSIKTFGSNIHEMLTDSFFLDQSLLGAFAEETIQDCLKKLRLLELGRDRVEFQVLPNEGANLTAINEEIKKIATKESEFNYEAEHALEMKNQKIYKIINMIGEPVVKYKLIEMYNEILAVEDTVKAKAKRDIQEIMERSGITKEEF